MPGVLEAILPAADEVALEDKRKPHHEGGLCPT